MRTNKLYIFGEMHSQVSDVTRIRNSIVEIQPDVVLHELYYDDIQFYTDYKINVIPLEANPEDTFQRREMIMASNMVKALLDHDVVCVVVGDTHIRHEPLDDIGTSTIVDILGGYEFVEFIRSPYREAE